MSYDSDLRAQVDLIMERSGRLAASSGSADFDAETLSALADRSTLVDEIDDPSLERLVDRFGTGVVVRAILSAPDEDWLPRRSSESPLTPPLAVLTSSRPKLWTARASWLAAAASICFVAVVTGLLLDRHTADTLETSPSDAVARPNAVTPRLQRPPSPSPTGQVGARLESSDRVAVLVQGEDAATAGKAESVLRQAVTTRRFRLLDPQAVEAARGDRAQIEAAVGGDVERLATDTRERGAGLLIVGDLRLSVGGAGRPADARGLELHVRMYRSADKRAGDATGYAAIAPAADADAMVRTAEVAAKQVSAAVVAWLDTTR